MAIYQKIITDKNFRAKIIFQPVYGANISFLADLILEDNLKVRVLPQLHKIIWGDIRGI